MEINRVFEVVKKKRKEKRARERVIGKEMR